MKDLNCNPVDTDVTAVRSVSSLYSSSEGELSYLKPMLETLPADMSDKQKRIVKDLLIRNADVFSKHEFDLGCTDLISFHINTGNNRPIAQPLRRHPRAHLDIIDQTVDRMLEAGIVEPAASPWSSNIVLVARPGGANPRMTVDFRGLNQIIYRDKVPLAIISDCLDAMSGSTFFSV